MSDAECTRFLQWALPRLGLGWPGFRRVRGQVCKRLKRRMRALAVRGFDDYRRRLASDPAEWAVLDSLCHITISRFWRDSAVFELLAESVIPALARRAAADGRALRAWSAGCASGEEPYTLKIVWDLKWQARFPEVAFEITATDIDETMLARARAGCFSSSSLRELPRELRQEAFDRRNGVLCVKPAHRTGIVFLRQDLRREAPRGPFDLIMCRNVAFTYFSMPLQLEVAQRLAAALRPSGFLVIGNRERLPCWPAGLSPERMLPPPE